MPFISSVRGNFGPQSKLKSKVGPVVPATLNWSTYGSGVTVTETSTQTYSVFNTSGSTSPWNRGANTTNYFKAPFTLIMRKNGEVNDNNNAYAMCGILPASQISNMRSDSGSSYYYGYNHYPVATNTNSFWYERNDFNGSQTNGGSGLPWQSGDFFYITVEGNGTLKYWRTSSVFRTVSVPTGIDWAVQVNNYSVNSTFGGFYNIRLIQNGIWDGSQIV